MSCNYQPRLQELSSAPARAALAEWMQRPGQAGDALALGKFLRARFDPEFARALAEQHALRRRATHKFADPDRMLLTRKGLEQATRLDVARWRAARIQEFAFQRPIAPVVDAGCGLGADSIALWRQGIPCLAIEQDLETALMAVHNLREATGRAALVRGSIEHLPARAEHCYLDPDRRGAGAASLDPGAWSPPWPAALAMARAARGACIKLAPGIDLERCGLPATEIWRWHPTWVSAGGELRECSLWCGEWAGDARAGEREAVVLRGGTAEVAASLRALPRTEPPLEPEDARQVRWLADPDPAVIRSGLLGNVARRAGARPLAAEIAYVGSREPIADPLLEAWQVLDACPLDPRRVRRMLDSHDVGAIEVRKRGHPEAAEVLAKRLAGRGSRRGVVVVARLERGHQAYLLAP